MADDKTDTPNTPNLGSDTTNTGNTASATPASSTPDLNPVANSPAPGPNKSTKSPSKKTKVQEFKDLWKAKDEKKEKKKPSGGGNAHVQALEEGSQQFEATMEAYKKLITNPAFIKMLKDAIQELTGIKLPEKCSLSDLIKQATPKLSEQPEHKNTSQPAPASGVAPVMDEAAMPDPTLKQLLHIAEKCVEADEGIELTSISNTRPTSTATIHLEKEEKVKEEKKSEANESPLSVMPDQNPTNADDDGLAP